MTFWLVIGGLAFVGLAVDARGQVAGISYAAGALALWVMAAVSAGFDVSWLWP